MREFSWWYASDRAMFSLSNRLQLLSHYGENYKRHKFDDPETTGKVVAPCTVQASSRYE